MGRNKSAPIVPTAEMVERFERFYKSYPLHAGKKDAAKAFHTLNPDEELLDLILLAIDIQVREKANLGYLKQRDKTVFIPCWPLPATWLRGERWTDEVELKRPKKDDVWVKPEDYDEVMSRERR